MADDLLTVPEVAKRLRVSEETVRRWLRDGRLSGRRLPSTRAGWRIPASELHRFVATEDPEGKRRAAA